MASDPEGTAKRFGVQLDGATKQTLRSVSDRALSRRVSKAFPGGARQHPLTDGAGSYRTRRISPHHYYESNE
jgi:hypothetical protein